MADLPLADELAQVYARLSGLLVSDETMQTVLPLIMSVAVQTVPGAAGAGVTLLDEHGGRASAAATDPFVERADALQYELGEGPCLTAWAERRVVRVDDMATEPRWRRWCSAAAELGLRSTLSAGLVAGGDGIGATKVYSREPAAFGVVAERIMTLLAAQAAVHVANVRSYQKAQRVSDELKEALRSRDVIGQAKGVLIGQSGVDEDAAFAMLVSVSQRENRKLRDVAEDLVRSAVRRRR